jgi:hypothetical protein
MQLCHQVPECRTRIPGPGSQNKGIWRNRDIQLNTQRTINLSSEDASHV